MIEIDHIYNGDCLELMKEIPDGTVDMVCCDLPYGVLNRSSEGGSWDTIIPFEPLWREYERVTKENAAIVLFAQGMFTAKLMLSNERIWRYNLIWDKVNRPTGFLDCKRKPMRIHEDICVFYKSQPIYNPQMTTGCKNHARGKAGNGGGNSKNRCYGSFNQTPTVMTTDKYPLSIVSMDKEHQHMKHPTQKPVDLIRYLVRTYTNRGGVILDNCIGSGTTAVACIQEKRHYIGMELDSKYYKLACKRVREEQQRLTLDFEYA